IDAPRLHKVPNDSGIILHSIKAGALGHGGEVVEQVWVFAIVHMPAWHGNDSSQQTAEGDDPAVGVLVHDGTDDSRIEGFVAGLVARNPPADLPKGIATLALSHDCGVLV